MSNLESDMLDIVLNHVGKHAEESAAWHEAFRLMCKYYLSHMDGDTHHIEDAYALMLEHGFVDEDGFATDAVYGDDA